MSSSQFKNKSKKVKVEPVKKPESFTKKRLIASLWNNKAAFDGGRFEKGWIATLLFVVSIVVALVPAMVSVLKTKGSDIFGGSLYHTDVALAKFVESLDTNDVDIKVVSKNDELIFADNTSEGRPGFAGTYHTTYALTDGASTVNVPYYSYSEDRPTTITSSEGVSSTIMVPFEYLRVYFTADIDTTFGTTATDAGSYLSTKLAEAKSTNNDTITTHIIIGRKVLVTRIYNPNSVSDGSTPILSFSGKSESVELGLNIRTFASLDVDGMAFTSADPQYTKKVVANFANFYDQAYKSVKATTFWFQTGLYAVIFTLIGLVMGLIIFISTRGKHNPNRNVSFLQAMKVGAWLLPTPALITLILGFILSPEYFQMVFIMALGMRSVFLTMRTLNPTQQ